MPRKNTSSRSGRSHTEEPVTLAGIQQVVKKVVGEIVEEVETRIAKAAAKGFEEVHEKFEAVDRRFDQIDRRFDEIDRRLGDIDQRLDYHAEHHVTKSYFVKEMEAFAQSIKERKN